MDSPEISEGAQPEDTFPRAKDAALRFLAYRPRSEAEVRRRLARKFSPDIVDRVINALLQQHYLSDQAFARQWRANREQHRPRAQRLVRQELNRLGVSPENIDQAMGGFDDEANAYREGFKLSRRLTARGVVGEDFNRRVGVRLKLRGFSYSVIRETLRKLRDEES